MAILICQFVQGFSVATLLWPSVGVKPNTWKKWGLESFGTPECSELDSKAQNTSHWGVLGVIGKVLKRRYRKCPRIGHLDIYRPSYEQKKGRESNWQFDSRPLKVGNRPLPNIRIGSATWRWKALEESYNFSSDLVLIRLGIQEIWAPKVSGLQLGQFRDNFWTPTWESREKEPFGCSLRGVAQGEPLTGREATTPSIIRKIEKVQGGEWRREYYMGEGGGFPRVRTVVSLVCQSARSLSQHPKVFPNTN